MASVQDIFNRLALGETVRVTAPTMTDRKYLYKILHAMKIQHNRDMSVLEMDHAMIRGAISVVSAKDGTGAAVVSVSERGPARKEWIIIDDEANHADVSGNLGEA